MALFFLSPEKGYLIPIAIQLFQEKGDDNPVRTIFLSIQSEETCTEEKWTCDSNPQIHKIIYPQRVKRGKSKIKLYRNK